MDESRANKLLAEYQANVELWKHDDSLRQQRQNNFLTVNTVLFVGIGAVTSFRPPELQLGLIVFLFSSFGLLLSQIWNAVQARNAEYVRFRRFQLQHIERKLGEIDTFTHTYNAFYRGKKIEFGEDLDSFVLSEGAQKRSTLSEGHLPTLLGVFWAISASVSLSIAFIYLAA